MLIQSLFISDISDGTRKQKYLGHLSRIKKVIFPPENNLNKSIIKNVTNSISSSTAVISLYRLKDPKKGQRRLSPVTQPQRLCTHQYAHKSDERVVVMKSRGIQPLSDERGFVRD